MSHFTSIKTKIKDESALIKALENMGLKPQLATQGMNLRNRWGTTDTAHIIILQEQLKCNADLGFKRTEDCYEITADDYELARSKYPNFRQDFATEYACVLAQRNGYKILSRERNTNGKIQIKLQALNQIKIRR